MFVVENLTAKQPYIILLKGYANFALHKEGFVMRRHNTHKFPEFDFKVNKKVIIIGGVLLTCVIGAIAFKTYKDGKAKQLAQNDYSMHNYTVDQLEGGTYYIKTGDTFNKVVPGTLLSTAQNDTAIPKQASPETRILMLGQDDQQVPTLYSDTQLIYKAQSTTDKKGNVTNSPAPTDFYLERFADEGYSIGIHGLSTNPDATTSVSNEETSTADADENAKYRVIVNASTFYPNSSISSLNCKTGDNVIIDKIDGLPVNKDNVSISGTVTGLTKGKSYKVDAYSGTNYIGTDAVADTHMFSSFELYDLKDYSMDPNNYLIITMPDYMWSGYYYINGLGLFRYINNPQAKGNNTQNFNTPYFKGTDKSGNEILNPASTAKKETENTKKNSDDSFVWNYDITIDNPQKSFNINVNYSDAKTIVDGKIISEKDGASIPGKETPSATITSPSGKSFDLTAAGTVDDTNNSTEAADATVSTDTVSSTETTALAETTETTAAAESTESTDKTSSNSLCLTADNPETGTWKLTIKGMYARTFNVSTTFAGSTSNMIVKDGNSTVQMPVYVPAEIADGYFIFTWENKEHAGSFEIKGPDGTVYDITKDPSLVTKETYGEVDIHLGDIKQGEYLVNISGESLGHVYFKTSDSASTETTTETAAETSSSEVKQSDGSNSDN
jgi:hypothetical protein